MKTNTVARKYKTFPCPCYFLFNWPRKARISKKKFPVPYPIIYNLSANQNVKANDVESNFS